MNECELVEWREEEERVGPRTHINTHSHSHTKRDGMGWTRIRGEREEREFKKLKGILMWNFWILKHVGIIFP